MDGDFWAAGVRRRRLAPTTVTTSPGAVYAGSPLVTPLYPAYEHEFRLSEQASTLIYAAPLSGSLVALSEVCRLLYPIGRRSTSFSMPAVAVLNTAIFVPAVHLAGLTLWALACGLLAQFVPGPLRAVSFVPRLGIPHSVRFAFSEPAAAAVAIFALLGSYVARIPKLVANSMREHSPALSRAVVGAAFALAVSVIAIRALKSRAATSAGLGLLPVSLALLRWARSRASIAVPGFATALCGIASALGFQGSMQENKTDGTGRSTCRARI